MALAELLRFPGRKTLLELNQEEIDRTTVEFSLANRAVEEARRKRKDVGNAIAELYQERERLVEAERRKR